MIGIPSSSNSHGARRPFPRGAFALFAAVATPRLAIPAAKAGRLFPVSERKCIHHGGIRIPSIRQFWLACLLTVIAFPAACAPPNQTKIVKWQEEVKLSTGEVIVVERETRFKPSGGEPFRGSGWAADVMTIRFHYPPDSKNVIEWRTVRYGAERHFTPEYPLALDVGQDRSIYLIALAAGKGACDEYYRYRYDNGQWKDDMLSEVFEKRAPNLLLGSDEINTPPQITLDFKRKFEADYHRWTRYDIRFRQIGPDRCLCGNVGSPVKIGCMQKYQATKE